MLMTEEMLNILSKEDPPKDYKDCNNDYDFCEVLKFCGESTANTHTIRYADGKEETFSFGK